MSKAAAIRWSNAPHELGDIFENVKLLCVWRVGGASSFADDCIRRSYNFADRASRGGVLIHNEDRGGAVVRAFEDFLSRWRRLAAYPSSGLCGHRDCRLQPRRWSFYTRLRTDGVAGGIFTGVL